MATWSAEFVNVSDWPSYEDLATHISNYVMAREGEQAPLGAILYFPTNSADWVIRTDSSLTLPEWIEVMIAPGARIAVVGRTVGMAEPYLVIKGKFTAPIGPVFATYATASWLRTPSPRPLLGTVIFLGDKIERVHPEWWGAANLIDPDTGEFVPDPEADTEALLEAIHSAWMRAMPPFTDPWQPPLVVELMNQYWLSSGIQIGIVPGRLDISYAAIPGYSFFDHPIEGLLLRGRSHSSDQPTFRCAATFSEQPMFRVQSTQHAVRFHSVGFDAGGLASRCVQLDVAQRQDVVSDSSEFRHCIFQGARQTLVHVESVPSVAGDTEVPSGVPNLTFEACTFLPERQASSSQVPLSTSSSSADSVNGALHGLIPIISRGPLGVLDPHGMPPPEATIAFPGSVQLRHSRGSEMRRVSPAGR